MRIDVVDLEQAILACYFSLEGVCIHVCVCNIQ